MIDNLTFSKKLDEFDERVLRPQEKRTAEAFGIMNDLTYKWRDDEQRKAGQLRLDSYNAYLKLYKDLSTEGHKLALEYEKMIGTLARIYEKWYSDISNQGKQESEMMETQAEMLNEIFSIIYKELEPLNLDIKPPAALNLK